MSTDLSRGRREPSKDTVGGIKAIYFANFNEQLVDSIETDEDDMITGFGTTEPLELFRYELRGTVHNFDEPNEQSGDNGTSFYNQSLTAVLKKQTPKDRKELQLATYGRPHIVVEDYNGNFRLGGLENGFDVQVDTASGSGMGDLNGYNLSATAMEQESAHFIDPTIIGDDTTSIVVKDAPETGGTG